MKCLCAQYIVLEKFKSIDKHPNPKSTIGKCVFHKISSYKRFYLKNIITVMVPSIPRHYSI